MEKRCGAVALSGCSASCELSATSDKREILTVHIQKIDKRFVGTLGGVPFFRARSAASGSFVEERVIFGGSLAGNVPSSSSSSRRSSSLFSRCEEVSFAAIGISASNFMGVVPHDCAPVRRRQMDSTADPKRRSVAGSRMRSFAGELRHRARSTRYSAGGSRLFLNGSAASS